MRRAVWTPLLLLLPASIWSSRSTGVHTEKRGSSRPFTVRCTIRCVGNLSILDHSGNSFNHAEFSYAEPKNGSALHNVTITGFGRGPFYVWLGYADGSSVFEPVPPFVFYFYYSDQTPFNPNFGPNETRHANLVIQVTGSPYYGLCTFELDLFDSMRGGAQPSENGGDDKIDMMDTDFAAQEFLKNPNGLDECRLRS